MEPACTSGFCAPKCTFLLLARFPFLDCMTEVYVPLFLYQ